MTGILQILLSCIKAIKPILSFKRELRIALEVLQGKRASSRVEGGISWFIPSCGVKPGVPLDLR